MCGLSGLAGDVSPKEEDVFRIGLWVSALRGMDSTGAAAVNRHFENGSRPMFLAKEVGPPDYLFDTKRFDELFKGTRCCYIGHNRSKTVGTIERKNAHPFKFDNIIGAHNGTLDWENKNRMECGNKFDSDSEALFNNIEVHGIADTIGRIESSEAYALTWYDRRDHTINFLRNDKRPLLFTFINKHKTLVWASEYELLMFPLAKKQIATDNKNVFVLPPDVHFKFKIPTDYQAFGPHERSKYPNYKKVYSITPNRAFPQGGKKNTGGTGTGTSVVGNGNSGPGINNGDDDYWAEQGMGAYYDGYGQKWHYDENGKWTAGPPPPELTPQQRIERAKHLMEARLNDATALIVKQNEDPIVSGITDVMDGQVAADGTDFSAVTAQIARETKNAKDVFDAQQQVWDHETNKPKVTGSIPKSVLGEVAEATKVLTADDFIRKRAWGRTESAGVIPRTSDFCYQVSQANKDLRVWRYTKTGLWHYFRWDKTREEWQIHPAQKMHPSDMPYHILHAGTHRFKGQGKREKKVIFYKAFGGKLLNREDFEKAVEVGCLECHRSPEWGNEVEFVCKDNYFLCEYCAMTPESVQEWINLYKEMDKEEAKKKQEKENAGQAA